MYKAYDMFNKLKGGSHSNEESGMDEEREETGPDHARYYRPKKGPWFIQSKALPLEHFQ